MTCTSESQKLQVSIQEWRRFGDTSVQRPDGSPGASGFQTTFPAYGRQGLRDREIYWPIS